MITRSADHRYTDTETGITVPGVTTAIEVVGASFDAASGYGAKHTAQALLAMVKTTEDGGYDLSALQTMFEAVKPEGVQKALVTKKNWIRDDAAQLGTDVHRLAEMVTHGQPLPDSVTPRQKVRVDHYVKWWEASGWTVRLTEAMVYRPSDDIASGWGGTFDLLAYDQDKRTVLADVKTGNLYPKVALQLAAYGMAKIVQPVPDLMQPPKQYPMPLPDRYVVLHVTEEGCREVEISIGTPERSAFLAALEIHNWLQTMKGKKL